VVFAGVVGDGGIGPGSGLKVGMGDVKGDDGGGRRGCLFRVIFRGM
jgi:hypothetical protein